MTEQPSAEFDEMVNRLRVEQQDRTYRTIERQANLRNLIGVLAEALNIKPAPDSVGLPHRPVDLRPGDQVRYVSHHTTYTVIDARDDTHGGILMRSNTSLVVRQAPRARLVKIATRNGRRLPAADQSHLMRVSRAVEGEHA